MKRNNLPPGLLEAMPSLEFDTEAQHPENGPPIAPAPRKYTQGLHDQIIANITAGQRPVTAAQMAGITSSTFYGWMQMGKQGNVHLVKFVDDVELAWGAAEAGLVGIVHKAAVHDPDLALQILERTRPAAYSKDVNAKVEGIIAEFLMQMKEGLPPEMYRAVLGVVSGQGLPDSGGPARFQLVAKPKDDDGESS